MQRMKHPTLPTPPFNPRTTTACIIATCTHWLPATATPTNNSEQQLLLIGDHA